MIEKFLAEKVSQFETEFVELSFLNSHFSFIPSNEFSTDTAQLYFESHLPLDPLSPIRFNPIRAKDCVVCFAYNEEIEFFFENKYPFVNIIHNSKRTLSKIPNELKNAIHLVFHQGFFEIIGISDSFEYYNCKSYETHQDVLYAVSHYLLGKNGSYDISIFGQPKVSHLKSELENQWGISIREIPETSHYSLISP